MRSNVSITDKSLSPEREAYIRQTADESATVPATHVAELLWEIERLRANGGEKRRLLACGLCYEEHGKEVHPHPECVWGRYPEHDKQEKVKSTTQAIGRFLEWASEEGYDFGRTVTDRVAVFEGTEDVTSVRQVERQELLRLLAKHFGIDLAKINAEKEQMLDDMRALNSPQEIIKPGKV